MKNFTFLQECLAVAGLIYLGLRKFAPSAVRGWLCICGTFFGGFFGLFLLFLLIEPFRDGWNLFGVFVVGTGLFFGAGAVAGCFAAYRLTKPRSDEPGSTTI